MKKVWIATAVVAVLALGGYVGYRAYRKLTGEGPGQRGRPGAAVAVEIAPVRTVTLRDVGMFTGSLMADSRFIVSPRIAGRLEKLLVNLGDPVRRGQLIAVLDDEESIQQAERAKAELAVAQSSVLECQSNLDAAKREFERAEALRQKKIASESEYDQAKAQYEVQEARHKVAVAQVTQKAAALKEAEIRLSYTKIHAAWEGGSDTRYVGERFVDEGALLTANAPIVSILDIGSLTAAVYVIERDYSKIAVGQLAKVTTDVFAGREFSGRIARIAPQLQETSRQARVEIAIANADGLLKPGMFVRVALEFAAHENAAAIPVSAVARRNGQRGVFVADAGGKKTRFVPVEFGISGNGLIEVVHPRLDGPVVVMGQHLLEDGAAIRVVPPETAASAPRDAERRPQP
ncbi:MAG TPA: efflux transporter periplasmic adaptor subunit [Phycisphaerales bacterium]|nr:efflux transporter periplasmic adaptor subunit [Phycisphaerales bacterium]